MTSFMILDKLNFRYNHFINMLDTDSLNLDGCFDTYLKDIYKYSMHPWCNYNGQYVMNLVDLTGSCVISMLAILEYFHLLGFYTNIINNIIDATKHFDRYSKSKTYIILTIVNSVNKHISTRYVYEYRINTLDIY